MPITKTSEISRKCLENIAYDLRSKNRSRSQQGDTNYDLCAQNKLCVFSYRGYISAIYEGYMRVVITSF